jgi:hypothetical protein
MSMLFAASFPERTVALLLCGAEVKEDLTDDWPWGESTREEFEESMATLSERWGRRPASLKVFVPSRGDDPALLDWYLRLKLQSASPAAAEAFMRMAHDIDVRDIAPAIRVPTLILHSTGDRICHVENARFLARTFPDARYIELPGADHVMFAELADTALVAARSTPRATGSSPRSTGRRGQSAVPEQSWTRSRASACRSGRASTRVSARSTATSSPGSPSTSARGSRLKPCRARCSCRTRCKT